MAKKVQAPATSTVANVSQIAAYSAVKNGRDATNKMKERFKRRRIFAIDAFNNVENVNLIKAQGAFYLFPDISFYCKNNGIRGVSNSIDFCNWLLDE